jgi:hypothetical protein
MPTIQYPDVPSYPGVPPIPRTSAGSPAINISLSTGQSVSTPSASQEPIWGIFSAVDNSPLFTPSEGSTLSTYSFDYSRQTTVATFPVESGSFVSYDKVWSPANPIVTLAFSGSEVDKWNLLANLDVACDTPTLWNVLTPDAEYDNYTIDRYSYRRMATAGASMLLIDVSLKEVLQVTLSYSSVNNPSPSNPLPKPKPKPKPIAPCAVPCSSNGQVQPSAPSSRTLQKAYTWVGRSLGLIPPSD